MDNIYAGVAPVTAEWIGAHKGEVWTIPFVVTLDEPHRVRTARRHEPAL